MNVVKVCPEVEVVMDVDSGLIAEMRKDVIMVDFSSMEEEINKLEKLAKAFENSLDPRSPPLKAYAGRDGTYAIGGIFQGFFFGFWISLALLVLGIILIISLYPKILIGLQ
jgi:tetrahydromethanopterin S-methyltransferase subunit B